MTILQVDTKNKMAYCQVKGPDDQSMEIWLPFAMLKQYGVARKDIVVGAKIS